MKNSKIDITYEIIRKKKKKENQIEIFIENFLLLSFFNFVILYVLLIIKKKENEENKKLLNKFMETIFYHQILIDLKINMQRPNIRLAHAQ